MDLIPIRGVTYLLIVLGTPVYHICSPSLVVFDLVFAISTEI